MSTNPAQEKKWSYDPKTIAAMNVSNPLATQTTRYAFENPVANSTRTSVDNGVAKYTPGRTANSARVEKQTATATANAGSALTSGGGGYGNGSYMAQLNALYDQIVNRKPFQYDLNADLLYRQMADEYTLLGQQASRDAMGQAAGLTGGYGNSYAPQVGNQAYQQYLTALNQNIPDLYDRALQAWRAQGDDLLNRYNLALSYAPSMYNSGTGGTTSGTLGTSDAANKMNSTVMSAATQQMLDNAMSMIPSSTEPAFNRYKKWAESQLKK